MGVAVVLLGVGLSGPALAKPDAGGTSPSPSPSASAKKKAEAAPEKATDKAGDKAAGKATKSEPAEGKRSGSPSGAEKAATKSEGKSEGKSGTRSETGSGSASRGPVQGWVKGMKEPAPAASGSPGTAPTAGAQGAPGGHIEATPSAGATDPATDAPVITGVDEGDNTLTITWSAPASGQPDSYEVLFNGINPANCEGGQVASPCLVASGLSNGTTVKVEVVAHYTEAGTTATSNAWYATPNAGDLSAPAAPVIVASPTGPASFDLAWDEPNNGGTEILGYHVTITRTHGSAGSETIECTVVGTMCSAAGEVGNTYSATVKAYNTQGESAASNTETVSFPVIPGAPTATASASGTQISVSWEAGDTGGAPSVTYAVTVAQAGDPGTTVPCTGNPSELDPNLIDGTSCTATGVPGTTYDVSVRAHNAAGDSAEAGTATASVIPAMPTVQATASENTITVDWLPNGTHPDSIAGYTVSIAKTGDSGTTIPCSGEAASNPDLLTGSQCTATGEPGTSYDVSVTAHNDAGPSDAGTQTVLTAPVAPQAPNVEPSATGTTITVNFTPNGTGGASIDGYEVMVTEVGSGSLVPCEGTMSDTNPSLLAGPSCTATGGVPGTKYDVTVMAHNVAGPSQPGTATVSVVPAMPTVQAAASSGTITVDWLPNGTDADSITGYEVSIAKTGEPDATIGCAGEAASNPDLLTGSQCTATGEPGAMYDVSVKAHNAAGPSEAGTTSVAVDAVVPDAPTVGTSVDGATVTVTFSANATGGATIDGFAVSVTEAGSGAPVTCDGTLSDTNPSLLAGPSCTATGVPGTTYDVAVTAVNAMGPSNAGTALVSVIPAPPAVTASVAGHTITVSWEPTGTHPETIDGYDVTIAQSDDPGTTIECSGQVASNPGMLTGSSCTATGVYGKAYNISVTAHNDAGNSEAGLATAEVAATTPMAPSVTAGASNDTITVNWSLDDDGGTEILGYEVTVAEANTGVTVECTGTQSQADPSMLEGNTCTATGVPGTTYNVSVRAFNAIGASPPGEQTVAVVPAPPSVITLMTGNMIAVYWEPTGANPETVTDYEVTIARSDDPSETLTCTDAPPSDSGMLSCTATGVYGTSYNVSVTALNEAGTSEPGTATADVVVVEPGAPAVNASASGNTITVEWTAPSIDGGAEIDGYQVTIAKSDAPGTTLACEGTPSSANPDLLGGDSCTATGEPGTSYNVSVMAHNSIGFSGEGTATVTTAPGEPAAPVVTPTVSGQSVTIAWAPGGSNEAVDGYEVTIHPTGTPSMSILCPNTPKQSTPPFLYTGTSCTFDANGTNSFDYSVRAHNVTGYSPATTGTVTMAPTVPGAPGVSASASGTTITVNWTPPGNTGNATIDGYEVKVTQTGTTTTVTCTGTPASPSAPAGLLSGSSCTATGVPGASYSVAVKAHNSVGYSEAGTATANVAATVPEAPEVTATVNGMTINVVWSYRGTGGAQITGYEATVTQAGTSITVPCTPGPTNTPPATSCTANGAPGATYNVSVKAVNSVGPSAAGTASVTVGAVPPAAPSVNASTSGTTITVNWTPPGNTGGATIDGYAVKITQDGTTTTVTCTGTAASPSAPAGLLTGSSCTATGMPGASYTIEVKAHTSAGYSVDGTATAIVDPVVPDAPTVTASASGTTITVEWAAHGTGGAEIDGYEVKILKSGTASPLVACAGAQEKGLYTGTSCTATGEPGASYDVSVQARNSAGLSVAGTDDVTLAAAAPAAPTVSATASGTTISVTWSPNSTGGAAISGYEVTLTPAGTGASTAIPCTSVTTSTATPPTSCTATGVPGATYNVSVKAQNSAGVSDAGTATVTVGAVAPAAPSVTIATSGSTGTVTWTPGETGGAPIQGYHVHVERNSGPGADEPACTGTTTGTGNQMMYTGTSCTFAGVAGATYVVQVTAVNSAGESEAGQANATVTNVPAPADITVTPGNASVQITWTPVANYPDVTGYTVTYTVENGSPDSSVVPGASATGTTVMGLENAKTYSVTVAANIGTGLVTTSEPILVTPTAPIDVPDALPSNPDGGLSAPPADTTPAPGEQIVISGSGYAPNSLVKVVIYSDPIDLGEVLTDQDGAFSIAVSVPSSLLGSHTIASIGFDSSGNPFVLTLPVTVTAAVSGGSGGGGGSGGSGGGSGGLAITGAPVMAILVLGVVLVAVGVASRYAGTRRRRQQ
jgi:hypothetical protein